MNHQLTKEREDANVRAADIQKKIADIQDISEKRHKREQEKNQVAQVQANSHSQIIDLNNEMVEMVTGIEEQCHMYLKDHGKVLGTRS